MKRLGLIDTAGRPHDRNHLFRWDEDLRHGHIEKMFDVLTTDLPDIASGGMTILQSVFPGGTNVSEVEGYVIANGGPAWPQGFQYLSKAVIGKTSQDMNG